ncbi:MAG: hypothetical protein H6506_04890 [Calditrichaeota bacterium]|nr:hypothetical protein [Calditrichota bacterium]MCB9391972.1 hypothetical protein [Calditrichota bacterium]
MNLDIVLIDIVNIDGTLSSIQVRPRNSDSRVQIDRYRDIHPDRYHDEVDIGGNRIYSSSNCTITEIRTNLKSIKLVDNKLGFHFEHMHVPIGPSREAHGGIYNLVLPIGWRLSNFGIVDPYDTSTDDIQRKRQFQYRCYWDKKYLAHLVEMDMRSGRGSFSFIVWGDAALRSKSDDRAFDCYEVEDVIARTSSPWIVDEEGKKQLASTIAKRLDWLELKPSFYGIGVDVKKMLGKLIEELKNTLRKS